jgi:hypothetical protein
MTESAFRGPTYSAKFSPGSGSIPPPERSTESEDIASSTRMGITLTLHLPSLNYKAQPAHANALEKGARTSRQPWRSRLESALFFLKAWERKADAKTVTSHFNNLVELLVDNVINPDKKDEYTRLHRRTLRALIRTKVQFLLKDTAGDKRLEIEIECKRKSKSELVTHKGQERLEEALAFNAESFEPDITMEQLLTAEEKLTQAILTPQDLKQRRKKEMAKQKREQTIKTAVETLCLLRELPINLTEQRCIDAFITATRILPKIIKSQHITLKKKVETLLSISSVIKFLDEKEKIQAEPKFIRAKVTRLEELDQELENIKKKLEDLEQSKEAYAQIGAKALRAKLTELHQRTKIYTFG